jgi:hypothetical protein
MCVCVYVHMYVCVYVKECVTLTFINKMLHKSEWCVIQRAFRNNLDSPNLQKFLLPLC